MELFACAMAKSGKVESYELLQSERRRESGAYLQSLVTNATKKTFIAWPCWNRTIPASSVLDRLYCPPHLQSIVLQTMASLEPASHMPLHVMGSRLNSVWCLKPASRVPLHGRGRLCGV